MPGLKRSPGLVDIDICQGAYSSGSSALKNAYGKARRTYDDTLVQRTHSLDRNRYPEYPAPATLPRLVPVADPGSPSADGRTSETPVHEGFENLESLERRITPPPRTNSISFEESGLPPTPPTLHNGDVSQEQVQNEQVSPPVVFADGVRNALQSKTSGQSATPVNAVSPPTPDPSPPVTTEDLPTKEQKGKPQYLRPTMAGGVGSHDIKQYPSSRAESFRTAREDQPRSPKSSVASPVTLPEDDILPQHWLDSTGELRLASIGLGSMTAIETPREQDIALEPTPTTPKGSRRRSKHESPPQTARGDSDWEKHISYVSGPDELDELPIMQEDPEPKQPATLPANGFAQGFEKAVPKGLGLSGAGLQQQDMERSAEAVNNMVYKRIQEENVKRHSVVSSTSGAINVGIILPADSTPRTLKRQTKCLSLRGDTTPEESKRGSADSSDARLISNKKIRAPVDRTKKLEASPVLESSIRQVSSPARLCPDASNMTALIYASLQDSPSARKVRAPRVQLDAEHKLRHLSHGDRLSNNLSVRRTSLHGSPSAPSNTFEIVREPDVPTWRVSNTEKTGERAIMNNVGIKRSSTEGARPSRVLEKPRGVIPSVVSDAADESLERSPTTVRLRRFSREERLENNEHVHRTSLEQERAARPVFDRNTKDFQVDAGIVTPSPDRAVRRFSQDRPIFTSSSDRVIFPTSPRKSIDARYLHPTTTPGSVSAFSDHTDNAELCEASGVRLFPHNNESLLLVQHGSRPTSKGKVINADGYDLPEELPRSLGKPIFAAQVDPPTPTLGSAEPAGNADSPLTNPRSAPEPPVIKFIPPTPHEELDRELTVEQPSIDAPRAKAKLPSRRLTLLQRARRYSDIIRTGSLRRSEQRPEERATYLSPLWRPHGFWDEFESEDEDDFDPVGSLPKGGDTSNVNGDDARRRAGLLPRAMSKRLPGFRGQGGFLVGNSLGLDRHGTNNRRHYVSTGSRTLSKRASEELLRSLSMGAAQSSQDSLRKVVSAKTFVVPFSGGMRAQWVGTTRFRTKMRSVRLAREEKAAEKRREKLRGQIGPRVIDDGSASGR